MLVFCLLFHALGVFFQPLFERGLDWGLDNDGVNGTVGFYEVPENTVSLIILGTSVAGCGVSSPVLYNEQGICAYNLSVSNEPLLASYYWAKEAERLHGGTLKTVVLDVSALRQVTPVKTEYYRQCTDALKFKNKLSAVTAYVNELGLPKKEVPSYFFQLFSYHSRWKDIGESDFAKLTYEKDDGLMGYELFTKIYADETAAGDLYEHSSYLNTAAPPAVFDAETLKYLYMLIDFCHNNGMELVLIKVPHQNWLSEHHNAVSAIAAENGLHFLDFNFYPVYEAINFDTAYDTIDGSHANYEGALKITSYLGKYLKENGLAR